MIYFIEDHTGMIKISSVHRDNFHKYLAQLEKEHAHPLKVLLKLEKSNISLVGIHKILEKHRISQSKEWFRPDPFVKNLITELSKTGGKKERTKWSPEMTQILKEFYTIDSPETLEKKLNLPWGKIKARAVLLKLPPNPSTIKDKKWTVEMDNILRSLYSIASKEELVEQIGLPWKEIVLRASKLKIPRKYDRSYLYKNVLLW